MDIEILVNELREDGIQFEAVSDVSNEFGTAWHIITDDADIVDYMDAWFDNYDIRLLSTIITDDGYTFNIFSR